MSLLGRLTRFTTIASILLAGPAAARSGAKTPEQRVLDLEQRIAQLEKQLNLRAKDISTFKLPDEVEICGDIVDLTNPVIRERVEKEFLLVLGNRAQVTLWAKRSRRVFPTFEAEARKLGTCTDMKYLAVTESGLRPAVASHASAKGWWQFMSGTARDYGLDVSRAWDDRADLRASTRAGLGYLKALENQFGSWPLAMAAYNTGPGRLRRAQKAQGVKDFWRLSLINEAERYVPRTIAIKTVMENLEMYGFHLPPEDGWKEAPRGFVKIRVPSGKSIELLAAAQGTGIDYRELKRLNPELGTELIPTGREVVFEVPAGREKAFRDWLAQAISSSKTVAKRTRSKPAPLAQAKVKKKGKSRSKARNAVASSGKKAKRSKKQRNKKKRSRVHTVRSGESLWLIAQKNKTTVAQLRKWNRLGRRSGLRPGQRLKIRR